MSQPWKRVERRGVRHYPDVSDENICIVSVDNFDTPHWHWRVKGQDYRGRTWFMVIFDDPSPHTFATHSSEPFATLEEAIRFAEEMTPTGIVWENSSDNT